MGVVVGVGGLEAEETAGLLQVGRVLENGVELCYR